MYRVGRALIDSRRQRRAGSRYDALQEMGRKLLALVVTYGGEPQLSLVAEELMIAYLARKEEVSPLRYGGPDEEVATATTHSDAANGTLRPRVVHHAAGTEGRLDEAQRVCCRHVLRQFAYASATILAVGQWLEDAAVL